MNRKSSVLVSVLVFASLVWQLVRLKLPRLPLQPRLNHLHKPRRLRLAQRRLPQPNPPLGQKRQPSLGLLHR